MKVRNCSKCDEKRARALARQVQEPLCPKCTRKMVRATEKMPYGTRDSYVVLVWKCTGCGRSIKR